MDLIKYYPITTYLLQDHHYEEITNDENPFILITYNKYSDMETTEHAMRQVRKKLNGDLHGEPAITCTCRGLGLLREGKLLRDLKKEVHFYRGKIHKKKGPAYTWINEGVEIYLYVNYGCLKEAVVIKKVKETRNHTLDLYLVDHQNFTSCEEDNKIIYKFKDHKVFCQINVFCELEICDYICL